jgi:hypothetical protein
MESEMIVAESRTGKQIDGGRRESSNLLMIWVMGMAREKIQMDPGTSFHPGWVISHTQYACTVNMAHIRTKNAATPEGKGLAQHRKDIGTGFAYIAEFSSAGVRG